MRAMTQWLLPATASLMTLAAPSGATAQDGAIIQIDEGVLTLCGSYSKIQILYALILNNQELALEGCWAVDPPVEVIVLQRGALISQITYKQRYSEDRETPLTKWYLSPAWAFTEWLEQY